MTTRVLAAVTLVLVTLSFPVPSRAQSVLSQGLWIDKSELTTLPTSGTAWTNLLNAAQVSSCGHPNLSDQEDPVNVCIMAKALVFARTGNATMRLRVVDAILDIVNSGVYVGPRPFARTRAGHVSDRGRSHRSQELRSSAQHADSAPSWPQLLVTPTTDGPVNLIDCHERRPNNWGNHCGASRVAVAAYLGDTTQLARAAKVFKGYLGDRASYAGVRLRRRSFLAVQSGRPGWHQPDGMQDRQLPGRWHSSRRSASRRLRTRGRRRRRTMCMRGCRVRWPRR